MRFDNPSAMIDAEAKKKKQARGEKMEEISEKEKFDEIVKNSPGYRTATTMADYEAWNATNEPEPKMDESLSKEKELEEISKKENFDEIVKNSSGYRTATTMADYEAWNATNEAEPKIEPILEPEPKPIPKPEKNPEDLENERKELEDNVKKFREAYAKKDYEATNVFSKIKNVFGKHLKSDYKEVSGTLPSFNEYKEALQNLLNYEIDKIRESNLSEEDLKSEIEKLTKYYNQDEKTNLYEAHTDARAQVWEEKFGKTPGYLAEKTGKFVNWYRKVDWKKKVALGVVLGASGLGFAVAGQRILGGAVAGTGLTGALEGRYRKKEGERAKEKRDKIMDEIQKAENQENKFDILMEKMRIEMANYDKNLKTEKDKARNRKLLGATAGIFIGAGGISWLSEKTGLGDALKTAKEFWFGVGEQNVPSGFSDDTASKAGSGFRMGQEYMTKDDIFGAGVSDGENIPAGAYSGIASENNLGAEKVVSSDITGAGTQTGTENIESQGNDISGIEKVQKGDSVWKLLDKQLQARFGDEFQSLNTSQKTYIIDAFKDKVVEDPNILGLENADKIKIGQEIDFSKLFEGEDKIGEIFEKAENLSADQIESIEGSNKAMAEKISNVSEKSDVSEQSNQSGAVEESSGEKNAVEKEILTEEKIVPKAGEVVTEESISGGSEESVESSSPEEVVFSNEDSSLKVESNPEIISERKQLLEKYCSKIESNVSISEKKSSFFLGVMKKLTFSSPENWEKMGGMKIYELRPEAGLVNNSVLYDNFRKTEEGFIDTLGFEKGAIGKKDTIEEWLTRVTREVFSERR
jgi:hypothetical protein